MCSLILSWSLICSRTSYEVSTVFSWSLFLSGLHWYLELSIYQRSLVVCVCFSHLVASNISSDCIVTFCRIILNVYLNDEGDNSHCSSYIEGENFPFCGFGGMPQAVGLSYRMPVSLTNSPWPQVPYNLKDIFELYLDMLLSICSLNLNTARRGTYLRFSCCWIKHKISAIGIMTTFVCCTQVRSNLKANPLSYPQSEPLSESESGWNESILASNTFQI